VAIAPIQGVQGTLYTIPVTPVRPVAPAVRTEAPAPVGAPAAGPADTPEALEALAQGKAVATAAQTAVTRQGGMAPLFADLAQALQSPDLPAPVRAAAAQLLAQAAPLDARLDGAAIARTLTQSGLFLENRLAVTPKASPAGQDLKADLLILREALEGWLGTTPRPSPARTAKAPPPPYRGGPTAAQPTAAGGLPADAPAAVVGQRLAEDAEAALARHELMQLASLPPAPQETADSQVTRWMFEAPFMTPQGATVAQFEVSRDDGQAGRDGAQAAVYRARFSVDIEPLGPIHAHVSLAGDHAGVALWAERDASVALLRGGQAWLSQALAGADLRSDITVYPGAPPRPNPGAGQFVDRST